MRTRTNRKVGKPTAAVIFLTWRNLPSLSVIDAQEVGRAFRRGSFGARTEIGNIGYDERIARFGLVLFPSKPISTPRRIFSIASDVICPST
jgi:hypothetical protein